LSDAGGRSGVGRTLAESSGLGNGRIRVASGSAK
jgi:hypothetical protein